MTAKIINGALTQLRSSLTAINIAIAVIVGFGLGTTFSVGRSFYESLGLMSFQDAWIWVRGLCYGCVIAIAIFGILCLWDWYQNRDTNCISGSKFSQRIIALAPGRRILAFGILTFILWIPAFLSFYPGNYSSDGPIQVTYLLNEGIVDLHWPAAHTLVLAGCMQIGNLLFGSYNTGVSLFCLVQAFALAFAMAFATSKALDWGAPVWITLAINGIMVLNPVLQAYAVTTAKDSLFAVFFILSVTLLIDFVKNPAQLTNIPFLTKWTLSVLGMCLMRKQGLYVVIIVVLIALPFIKQWRQRLGAVISIAMVFALSAAFSGIVANVANTRADSARETLSVPSQQIVRTYMYDYNTLTDEQIQQIGTYYDLDALEAGRTTTKPWDTTPIGKFYDTDKGAGYLAPISDPAKAALLDDAFSSNPTGYAAMYFSVMNGHLSNYVRAFLWGEIGYLYPTSSAMNRWTGLSPWNEFNRTIDAGGATNQVSDYNQTTKFPTYLAWLHAGTWDMFRGHPLLTIWVSPALPFLAMLLSLILLIKRKKNKNLIVAWAFPFLYWATLALAPVMCVRYVVPLFFALPLIVVLPILKDTK
ncbi:hypothetical protein BISA_1727 [Bifidobacterium saguini DSM 23967]|uniref:Uncharacterized protein n=2 Tax=Bifidobacterium saguini TaxID=762210 RepID=A0A087DEF3_9BIFI|nr:DUF6020 family protein [Bifidobacterium saguini]KFI93903.1 hypothetical protein BISA_1727 [Bifidobacterium saguini DSM 23967]QTB90062.1 hypothetical protein BSD967_06740 [Bifidobacterium saguini]